MAAANAPEPPASAQRPSLKLAEGFLQRYDRVVPLHYNSVLKLHVPLHIDRFTYVNSSTLPKYNGAEPQSFTAFKKEQRGQRVVDINVASLSEEDWASWLYPPEQFSDDHAEQQLEQSEEVAVPEDATDPPAVAEDVAVPDLPPTGQQLDVAVPVGQKRDLLDSDAMQALYNMAYYEAYADTSADLIGKIVESQEELLLLEERASVAEGWNDGGQIAQENAALDAQVDSLQKKLAAMQSCYREELVAKDAALAEANAQLSRQQDLIDSLTEAVNSLQQQVAAKDERIEYLRAKKRLVKYNLLDRQIELENELRWLKGQM